VKTVSAKRIKADWKATRERRAQSKGSENPRDQECKDWRITGGFYRDAGLQMESRIFCP
jgi:hypothetical protein